MPRTPDMGEFSPAQTFSIACSAMDNLSDDEKIAVVKYICRSSPELKAELIAQLEDTGDDEEPTHDEAAQQRNDALRKGW